MRSVVPVKRIVRQLVGSLEVLISIPCTGSSQSSLYEESGDALLAVVKVQWQLTGPLEHTVRCLQIPLAIQYD